MAKAKTREPGLPIVECARRLRDALAPMRFAPPVEVTYNPLEYAWQAHALYLERFANGPKPVVILGMNPGPFGMVQTGVPFGDPAMVREFLKITPADAVVEKPAREHPKRRVEGLASTQREVSGTRVWGWARETFGSAEAFAERFVVLNHCPLAFVEASGANRVPEKLPKAERAPLFAACDHALGEMLALIAPRLVVGLGRYAEARALEVLAAANLKAKVAGAPHPSPANPGANKDWGAQMSKTLRDAGETLP